MKVFLTLLLSVLLESANADAVARLDATLMVIESDEIEAAWHSDEIIPYFRFIPGSIFGNPIEDVMFPVEVENGLRLTQMLTTWESEAETHAAPLTDENIELGLSMLPQSTRLLRVATFAGDLKDELGMGGAFQELGKDGYVVLIYVSEPCEITGVLDYEDRNFIFDVRLEEKGFHFISVSSESRVVATDIDGKLVFITLH